MNIQEALDTLDELIALATDEYDLRMNASTCISGGYYRDEEANYAARMISYGQLRDAIESQRITY